MSRNGRPAATLTSGDEKLLDELHDAARRLDDRLCTIERIMTAENPNWRQQCLPGRERDASACSRTVSEMADDRYPRASAHEPAAARSERPHYPIDETRYSAASRPAGRASIATSATARSWAFAPGSPIIPGFDVSAGPDLLPRGACS